MCTCIKSGVASKILSAGLIAAAVGVGAYALTRGTPTAFGDDKAAPAKPAVTKAAIGETAPTFTLKDTDGKELNFAEFSKGKTVVLEWFNPSCPFVVKQYAKTTVMADTRAVAKANGAVWLTINSGAAGKEGAGKDASAAAKTAWKIDNQILLDEEGTVGKMYGAKTTPHMYIIKDGKLVYAGAIDNDRSADKKGDKNYVIQALNELKDGKPVSEPETKAYGCSVKYK